MFYSFTFPTVIKQEKVYGLRGGSVELAVEQLPEGTKVTSIVWKYGNDKVTDWVEEDGEDVTYYAKFKSNSTLNKKTWGLKISNLQPSHAGMYSSEVNNKDATKKIHLIVLSKLLWKMSLKLLKMCMQHSYDWHVFGGLFKVQDYAKL